MTSQHVIVCEAFRSRRRGWMVGLFVVLAMVFVSGVVASSSVLAAAPAGGLSVNLFEPLHQFSEARSGECEAQEARGQCFDFQVTATDAGSVASAGPVVVRDVLPPGLSVTRKAFLLVPRVPLDTTIVHAIVPVEEGECVEEGEVSSGVTVVCTYLGTLQPDEGLQVNIRVTVGPEAVPDGVDRASVSGPDSPEVATSEPVALSTLAPAFGVAGFEAADTGVDGATDVQAGDHPYELTTRIDLNSTPRYDSEGDVRQTGVQDLRDAVVELPIGMVGSAQATPKCTFAQLASLNGCPPDTRVGQILTEPSDLTAAHGAVYNLVPEEGLAAQFGFHDGIKSTHVLDATLVPAAVPGGYVLRATTREVPQISLMNAAVTFYGDPAARAEQGATPVTMFTNPTDCTGEPLDTSLHIDSWQNPGVFPENGTPAGEPELNGPNWVSASSVSPPVTGCELLHFQPSAFTFAPEEAHSQADEPSGYESVLRIGQTETPGTLATPPLKTAVVTLPAGVSISPSAAGGLVGCQETGPEGIDFQSPAQGGCPDASKVGTVKVATPLIEEELEGSVFVAQPSCGGAGQAQCSEALAEEGRLFAIYLEVGSRKTGIHLKLKGKVEVGGNGNYSHEHGLAPGQIRTSFIETPQAPFSELKLNFNPGARAPLANPQSCGTYTTDASFEPWSAPQSGPNAVVDPSFAIAGGCGGGFAPSFSAGTVDNHAGSYSAFTTTFGRHDGEQDLSGLELKMPEGLIGKIAGLAQCGEAEIKAAQADAGGCPAASKIGTATAAAGPGSDPYWQSGSVYLTGPYNNGPFGLVVVVPAVAGPFNLGNIVVRASIRINPNTAQVSVLSDPLPQSVDGVPLRVQTVNVTVGQEGNFTFNPTGCTPSSITATITSAQGASSNVSSPFQAADCAALKFAPGFTASTQANGSPRGNGASLNVKVAYPTPGTAYSNIAKVDTQLPAALSSRLSTLHQACTEAQFNANPAGCPAAATVGSATVKTPALANPLMGPAILVSHGNEAFPDLVLVLQGEGVTIDLTGNTDIKNGITYSKFETVPDAPVSSFELSLPEKENSILAAVKNLCKPTKTITVRKKVTVRRHGRRVKITKNVKKTQPEALIMPTTLTAQNGAVVQQNITVTVTGCASTAPKQARSATGKHHAHSATHDEGRR
jgi:hypothetical protein